jgi:hypothetical protein
MTFAEYTNMVLEYLDYLGFEEYILGYDPEDIAKRIYMGNVIAYDAFLISPRMCALFHMGAILNQLTKESLEAKVRH